MSLKKSKDWGGMARKRYSVEQIIGKYL